MKTKIFALLAVCGLSVLIAGCVNTVDGRKKAGVPFVKDKIDSRYERPVALVFTAAKEVLAFNGVLTSENTINNSLEAKVDTRTVWVRVDKIDEKITQVTVQTRKKGGGADIYLAAEIDKQIALKLR
jgi:hypothetical protein